MQQNLYLDCPVGQVLLKSEHAVDLPPQHMYIFPYQILSLLSCTTKQAVFVLFSNNII